MSVKSYGIFILLSLFLLVNCSSEKTTPTVNRTDTHTSQNSLTWFGTYAGTLPCASCPGIETTLILQKDHTFNLIMNYQDEPQTDEIRKTGSFSWNEAGNIISLDNVQPPNQYFVGENYVSKLDINGDRITGALAESYKLTKK